METLLVDPSHVVSSETPWWHHPPRDVGPTFREVLGQWLELIRICVLNEEEVLKIARRRSRRHGQDESVRRAERADQLVHLGELSSARQVLESGELAPGTPETLRLLRARPAGPRDPLPAGILGHAPNVEFQLDADSATYDRPIGSSGCPSGMTMEHFRVLLDSSRNIQSLFVVSELLAKGAVPNSIRDIVRIGRRTALQKPSGGVRGIVAGDVPRRVVSRTIAQKLSEAVEAATAPPVGAHNQSGVRVCCTRSAGSHRTAP